MGERLFTADEVKEIVKETIEEYEKNKKQEEPEMTHLDKISKKEEIRGIKNIRERQEAMLKHKDLFICNK